MKRIAVPTLFVILVIAAGALSGIANRPGPWLDGLVKPFFQPPAFLFAPVWTVLYVMVAVAGARIWLADRRSVGMRLWAAQMALNLMWSPAFFGLRSPGLGLAVIVPLFAVIAAFIVVSWRRDRVAAMLFAPYGLWTGYAVALNAAIVVLNR